MFQITIPVTDSQIDPDYKHAHHTTVLSLMEKGRIAFIESAGLSQKKLFEQDLWAVISEIHVEYFREIKKGRYVSTCDEIRVERRRMVFEQRILDSEGADIAKATIKIMWFSKKAGKAVTPPDNVMTALKKQISLMKSGALQ